MSFRQNIFFLIFLKFFIINVKYKGETVKLVKIVGSQANPSLTGTTTTWNKRRYYYRCDNTEDIENQVLLGDENNGAVSYIDKQ